MIQPLQLDVSSSSTRSFEDDSLSSTRWFRFPTKPFGDPTFYSKVFVLTWKYSDTKFPGPIIIMGFPKVGNVGLGKSTWSRMRPCETVCHSGVPWNTQTRLKHPPNIKTRINNTLEWTPVFFKIFWSANSKRPIYSPVSSTIIQPRIWKRLAGIADG